ncbi:MAG TPA: SpoIID/LytB domain-containing protein [Candidatus Krumholzibacteria bacterium]|nr:SpoIID/LytB domain-containing protein [Candidatus Krumholzibacteria bacterium]
MMSMLPGPGRVAAAGLILVAAGCAGPRPGAPAGRAPGAKGDEPVIRVLVFSTGGQATIATTGAFRVTSLGSVLLSSAQGGTVTVRRSGRSLQVRLDSTGQTGATDHDLVIEPSGAGASVAGVWYSGNIRAHVNEAGAVELVNELPLETYLEGVVPHEIGEPGADAYAAVQAQAVAARTYALSRIRKNNERSFDVESGVADQVYKGRERQSRLASAAVRDTRGAVLSYDGALCETYYSATCGGHTSDIRTTWPDRRSAPYLYGALDRDGDVGGAFCAAARNFRWRYSFSGRALGDMIRQTIPAALGIPADRVGDLLDVRVAGRTASGRVRRLDLVTSKGTIGAEADRIRRVVMLDVQRGRILPSTLFDVEIVMSGGRVGRVSFVGGGNGHGVGMCQNGAIGMARRGYSYPMILGHYYPGGTVQAAY